MNVNSIIANLDSSAVFSIDRKCRYMLWRIWDRSLPLVAFMGLNPSTANETYSDPTIKSVGRIAKHNGYGGIIMINCFPFVTSDPAKLDIKLGSDINYQYVTNVVNSCKDVVFAWGAFSIVKELEYDQRLTKLFPNAKCLHINKDGSPKHPLYCKSTSPLIPWKP